MQRLRRFANGYVHATIDRFRLGRHESLLEGFAYSSFLLTLSGWIGEPRQDSRKSDAAARKLVTPGGTSSLGQYARQGEGRTGDALVHVFHKGVLLKGRR